MSDSVAVYHGDCLDVMAKMPDASVDAIVTDPPYALNFMGKDWDSAKVAFSVDTWLECLRLLKPGGHLLAFGGSRTWHRLTVAIEDAGFEIRDSIAWLYGSGFPKSLDVSKAIDKAAGAEREVVGVHENPRRANRSKSSGLTAGMHGIGDSGIKGGDFNDTAPATDAAKQWQGWGTALKPSHEPVVVARKPIQGTVAANVLAHGTGALNIDACRVATSDSLGGGANKGMTSATRHEGWARSWMDDDAARNAAAARSRENTARAESLGRWPPNVVLDGDMADELDQQTGTLTSGKVAKGGSTGPYKAEVYGKYQRNEIREETVYGDSGGASRFFPVFRYQAKAPAKERPKVDGIAHPTVKPLALMRWLVKLVTPPNGIVLDPFAGSGATVEACVLEGFDCIAIEKESGYLPLIDLRLERSQDAA